MTEHEVTEMLFLRQIAIGKVNFVMNSPQMACQRLKYGRNSHLTSIHSAEENDFIFHLMGKPLDHTKGNAYWIGAHDTFKVKTLKATHHPHHPHHPKLNLNMKWHMCTSFNGD